MCIRDRIYSGPDDIVSGLVGNIQGLNTFGRGWANLFWRLPNGILNIFGIPLSIIFRIFALIFSLHILDVYKRQPCGSARITVRRSGEVVGFREVDTEKQCPTLTTTGLQAEETEEGLPSDNIVELINDLFSIGKSSSDTLDTQEVPDNVDRPSPGVPPGSGTPGPPGSGTPAPPGSGTPGPPSNTTVCQGTDALFVPGTEYKLGSIRNDCMRPTRIIIHWSGAWNSAEATLNTLNSRGLSCQLATDSSCLLYTSRCV